MGLWLEGISKQNIGKMCTLVKWYEIAIVTGVEINKRTKVSSGVRFEKLLLKLKNKATRDIFVLINVKLHPLIFGKINILFTCLILNVIRWTEFLTNYLFDKFILNSRILFRISLCDSGERPRVMIT